MDIDIHQNINRKLEPKDNEPLSTIFLIGNKCDFDNREISRKEAEEKGKESSKLL